jgi:hypothetical protein
VYEHHERTTTPARPVAVPPTAEKTRTRTSYGGLAVRIVLTLLGAAGLILGSFMNVVNDTAGTNVPVQSLWTTDLSGSQFVSSLGFAMIVVALVAVVGMALRTGVLTSLAGAVAIAATILFLVQVNRADGNLNGIDAGMWLWGIGGLLCLIGGFFGPRRRREVVETTAGSTYVER